MILPHNSAQANLTSESARASADKDDPAFLASLPHLHGIRDTGARCPSKISGVSGSNHIPPVCFQGQYDSQEPHHSMPQNKLDLDPELQVD